MLHTFLLAARAVGPSLVRNASWGLNNTNLARSFSTVGGGARVFQRNALTKSGVQAKPGEDIFIVGGVRQGMWATVLDVTKETYKIAVRGYRVPANFGNTGGCKYVGGPKKPDDVYPKSEHVFLTSVLSKKARKK